MQGERARPTLSQAYSSDQSEHDSARTSSSGRSIRDDALSNSPIGEKTSALHFIHFNHPSQAKTSKVRKSIRSHVTRRQHRLQRDANESTAMPSKDLNDEDDDDVSQSQQQAPVAYERRQTTTHRKDDITKPVPQAGVLKQQTRPAASPVELDLQPRFDLTNGFPSKLHSYVQDSVEFYYKVMMPDVPFLNAGSGKGLLRSSLIPFLVSEPISLQALTVFVAPFYGQARGAQPSHDLIDTLMLRGLALSSINHALAESEPSQILNDHVIVAIAVLGYHEFVVGERLTAKQHLSAVHKMVNMRGGLQTMGLDGLLERLLVWMDLHMSHLDEVKPVYKTNSFASLLSQPRLDVDLFFRPFGDKQ